MCINVLYHGCIGKMTCCLSWSDQTLKLFGASLILTCWALCCVCIHMVTPSLLRSTMEAEVLASGTFETMFFSCMYVIIPAGFFLIPLMQASYIFGSRIRPRQYPEQNTARSDIKRFSVWEAGLRRKESVFVSKVRNNPLPSEKLRIMHEQVARDPSFSLSAVEMCAVLEEFTEPVHRGLASTFMSNKMPSTIFSEDEKADSRVSRGLLDSIEDEQLRTLHESLSGPILLSEGEARIILAEFHNPVNQSIAFSMLEHHRSRCVPATEDISLIIRSSTGLQKARRPKTKRNMYAERKRPTSLPGEILSESQLGPDEEKERPFRASC
eukprot:GEMP01033440.1.p1 GENE.GEMP01033440.1~~GEMP01033440.1.p1  ORF type:complete len:325 (+),score=31.84 GEMP01033440.1:464-1438(+)